MKLAASVQISYHKLYQETRGNGGGRRYRANWRLSLCWRLPTCRQVLVRMARLPAPGCSAFIRLKCPQPPPPSRLRGRESLLTPTSVKRSLRKKLQELRIVQTREMWIPSPSLDNVARRVSHLVLGRRGESDRIGASRVISETLRRYCRVGHSREIVKVTEIRENLRRIRNFGLD